MLEIVESCHSMWVLEHWQSAGLLPDTAQTAPGTTQAFTNQGRQTLDHTSALLFNLRHWLPSGWRWLGALPQTAKQSQVAFEVTEVHRDRPSWAFTLVITVSHGLQLGICLYIDIFLNLKTYFFCILFYKGKGKKLTFGSDLIVIFDSLILSLVGKYFWKIYMHI